MIGDHREEISPGSMAKEIFLALWEDDYVEKLFSAHKK